MIKRSLVITVILLSAAITCKAQAKADTVKGFVFYYGSDFNGCNVTQKPATEVSYKDENGVKQIIYIKTEQGYINLEKNYEFLPYSKLQKLKRHP